MKKSNNKFGDEIWLLFSGDKGGNSMKFHVEIINDKLSGSRDCVHTFCIYEAPDYHKNIWKIFSFYQSVIYDRYKDDNSSHFNGESYSLASDYDDDEEV